MVVESIKSEKFSTREKVLNFQDAIDLAGNGSYSCYTVTLMLTVSMMLLAMVIELFSFSLVVSFCSCDFQLTMTQKSILVSIPFIGPVIMAYAWGYLSDTRGRRLSLLVALGVSFLSSALSAFSPNWIVLGVLKLISCCFISCVQSGTYTLLGESCPQSVKNVGMIFISSVAHLCSSIYFALGYFIGDMNFSYDMGFITFVPWRLLALVLALPTAMCFIGLYFMYESPKFLINGNRHDEALEIMKNIYRRNGGNIENYQVEKVVLNEEGNVSRRDVPLLQSMRDQTVPLFKPPLLSNTLLLYYIVFTIYGTNNGLYTWIPFIAKAFTVNTDSFNGTESESFCSLIIATTSISSETKSEVCAPKVDMPIMMATTIYGVCTFIINTILCKIGSRKKLLLISLTIFNIFCCVATQIIPSHLASFFYFGVLTSSIAVGPVSGYYVDLYPTSFRGMASCLGVMVCRIAAVVGINVIGPFLVYSCSGTFYALAAFLLSGVFAAFFLPPDRPKASKV